MVLLLEGLGFWLGQFQPDDQGLFGTFWRFRLLAMRYVGLEAQGLRSTGLHSWILEAVCFRSVFGFGAEQ